MDLRLAQLRTFREVARRGSFSRAAEALRLSQPAISLQVRQLEEMFGAALLERVGKRVFVTPAGETLLAHGERVFAELDAARLALSQRRDVVAGPVRLGTGATASIYLLPPLLRRLRHRHPALELSVSTGNTRDIAQAVIDNALDVAIVTLPVAARELAVTPFYRDPLVVIAPPEKRWRGARAIAPAALAREGLILFERGGAIRNVMDGWFARAGAAPRVTMELGNAEASKKLVGAGLGLSIISAIAVKKEVAAGELLTLRPEPPLARMLGLVRRRDKPSTPALSAVIAALDAFARKNRATAASSP
ncbi:MAG TPA: LysR family transcriptional regulator [Alphaproteobacteria bacterium]|nr:LysR family transcriptional regulator [Alphaproteobacteria bacterium]